jgi:hypothetical protein
MLISVVRYRLVFLVGVLVAAVLLGVLWQMEITVVSPVCEALLGLLWVGLAGAGIAALNARRPATFLVRAGAFTTPPSVGSILATGTVTVMPVALAALAVDQDRRGFGFDRIQIGVVVLLVLLLALRWYSVLGSFGMFLRPDGVLDRQPLGSVFVPWEAGPAAKPTNYGVRLRVARPDRLVRRGLRPGLDLGTGADRGFTAWAINLYATRPDDRPAIGTDDELLRLKSF